MTLRPRRPLIPSSRVPRAALAALLGAACVTLGWNAGDARAQASGAAAVSEAASAVAGGTQYTVKPGQSLNDIAGELTGSRDRAIREKMSRALFDANPGAFMGHDPSRLKLGAVLNVPAGDFGGASAASAASAPEAAESGAASAPASAQASAGAAAVAPAPEAAASTAAETGAGVQSAASAPGASIAAEAPAASEPAAGAGASAALAGSIAGADSTRAATQPFNPMTIAAAAAVLAVLLLLFFVRAGKRRRAAPADTRSRAVAPSNVPSPAVSAAANVAAARDAGLEGASVQRDQAELNAVAASLESYDAAQSFAAPTDDEPPAAEALDRAKDAGTSAPGAAAPVASREEVASRPAPFMPEAPAARHRDFMPPLRSAAVAEAEAREAATREAEAREAAERESAAREAEARDAADVREAEAREAAAREAEAREAEAREAEAREAETVPDLEADDEPTPVARFPQPKFPREAIEALDSLDLGLPPRRELSAVPADAAVAKTEHESPITPEPVVPQPLTEPDITVRPREPAPATADTAITPEPVRPQPVAEPDVLQRQSESIAEPPKPPSAAQEIEAGTAGPASVAGLGAPTFGPMRLAFDLAPATSETEPLPALTPEQIATIARNKLELAAEYIDLGDLAGARTLLQEVIDANDPATRPQAAALLSTLAPLS